VALSGIYRLFSGAPVHPVGADGRMALSDHLRELRARILKIALTITVAMVVALFFFDPIFDFVYAPYEQAKEQLPEGSSFATTSGAGGGLTLYLKLCGFAALVGTSPIWLYQIWAFLVPGLTRKEIGYALGFLFSAVPLFLAGCAAGWFVMPHIVELMVGFTPADASNFFNAGIYFDFVLKLVLAVGIAFVVPVFLVLLNFVGVLSAQSIIKSWRVAVLVIALFCAVATPAADVISMFILAIPMVLLYFAAYGVAFLHDRRAAKRQLAFDAELAV
jgi:sec-independent protein translocase protein TatC